MKTLINFTIDVVIIYLLANAILYFVGEPAFTLANIIPAVIVTGVLRTLKFAFGMNVLYCIMEAEEEGMVNVVAIKPQKGCTKADQNNAVCDMAEKNGIVIDEIGMLLFRMGFHTLAVKFRVKPDMSKRTPKPKEDKESEEFKAARKDFMNRIKKEIDDHKDDK